MRIDIRYWDYGDNMLKDDNFSRFQIKQKPKPTAYKDMPVIEQNKRVGVSLVLWSSNITLDERTRLKLKKMNVDKLVLMLNEFDAWALYGNRRMGLASKVEVILKNYEKEYGRIRVD